MDAIYGLMLRIFRRYLSCKRAAVRNLPDGTSDIISVFEHFNFLGLVPTFLAVALAPDHIFRRFDRVIKGKSLLFSSPAQCVVQFATFLAMIHFWKPAEFTQQGFVIALLVLGVTCPIWSYGILLFFRYVFSRFNWSPLRHYLDEKLDWFWVDQALTMLCPVRALRRLDWNKYLQGMMFFAVYSCVALPLALIPALPILALLYAFSGASPEPDQLLSLLFPYFRAVMILVIAYCGSWLILRPWAYLFLYCSKYPEEAALRYEIHRIQKLSNKIYFGSRSGDSRIETEREQNELRRELMILIARWKIAENRVVRTSPEHLQDLLIQRRGLAEDMLQYRLYFDRKSDLELLTTLDRIEAGERLGIRPL